MTGCEHTLHVSKAGMLDMVPMLAYAMACHVLLCCATRETGYHTPLDILYHVWQGMRACLASLKGW